MISIIDYGMGNLRSVEKALQKSGAETRITQDAKEDKEGRKNSSPRVGAMLPAMQKLNDLGLIEPIKESVASGKPFLGICLGYQLLFETSNEGGEVKGLGLLPGTVERFTKLKVPHMGWNQIQKKNNDCPLVNGVDENSDVYFCHSYYVKPSDPDLILTSTEYGIDFASSICKDNLFGVQFHPEKSQEVGLKILENFTKL